MQEYDIALKILLRGFASRTLQRLVGAPVEKWLDVELPRIQNPRADLLGETSGGKLVHIELQSGNDPNMPLRMLEYFVGMYRRFARFPRQAVLYVGEAPLRMEAGLESESFSFHYELVDIRDLDGEQLLASDQVGDNVIAILTRLSDRTGAIHEIVAKISRLQPERREQALGPLLALAGLRGLEAAVEEEIKKMPIVIDILENKVLGREYKRGREVGAREGRQEGRQEGEMKGRQEGELTILRTLIEKRFGAMPPWAEERLTTRPVEELQNIALRLFDAKNLEELLS